MLYEGEFFQQPPVVVGSLKGTACNSPVCKLLITAFVVIVVVVVF